MPDDEEPVPTDAEQVGSTEPDRDPLDLARRIADSYRGGGQPIQPRRQRKARPSPRRAGREDPTDLASVLGEVVRERGWDERLAAQRVFSDWASIVGPEVAQHSTVEGYEDGVVSVRTTSTAWAKQLTLLAPRVVARLNEELGDGSVLRVDVRGPQAPSWVKGKRTVRGSRGPRDTYG